MKQCIVRGLSVFPVLSFVLLALLPVPGQGTTGPTELTLLRTVGEDDKEILLYRPEAIAFGPDGSAYVVNGGDSTILQFDRDWNHVRTFAHHGQGPGEFELCTGLLVRDNKLWVFELGRTTLFSLEGEYLETLRTQVLCHVPIVDGEGFVVRLDGSDRAAARLDGNLELIQKIGPSCPTDDFQRRYAECGFMRLLPHPDWLCLLINPLDGQLLAVGEDGEVGRTISLTGAEGLSRIDHQDEESISISFTLVLGNGFVDQDGRLWSLPIENPDGDGDENEEEADEAPQHIEVRNRTFDLIGQFTVPVGIHGFELAQSPAGDLVLLDAAESLIRVLAWPELPGSD